MYGDHIPFFGGEVLKAMGLNGNGFETQNRQYSVPVLMWSNFNKEKILFSGENINSLSQVVLVQHFLIHHTLRNCRKITDAS